jgi:hypothetical protein
LREELRLRVPENRVLRRIFGSRRDKVTKEWRKLRIEELSDLYSSPIVVQVTKSRKMKCAGQVVRMEERRGVYRVLVGKSERKRPLERPRYRWKDNIKTDLQTMGCGGRDWIKLAQGRDKWRALVNALKNLRVP